MSVAGVSGSNGWGAGGSKSGSAATSTATTISAPTEPPSTAPSSSGTENVSTSGSTATTESAPTSDATASGSSNSTGPARVSASSEVASAASAPTPTQELLSPATIMAAFEASMAEIYARNAHTSATEGPKAVERTASGLRHFGEEETAIALIKGAVVQVKNFESLRRRDPLELGPRGVQSSEEAQLEREPRGASRLNDDKDERSWWSRLRPDDDNRGPHRKFGLSDSMSESGWRERLASLRSLTAEQKPWWNRGHQAPPRIDVRT